ncbi:uncharacterized protein LOC123514261 [Portunus trituberculatus]|uniref:uncharacterized protein LOC123514261 n=1 Tax=Portunus trituberculatus TaxID=210409 RepID=UPI001E1CF926|nr:uncharacterized protein LOC123514261 [Portunus trituberculatus]
MYRKRGQGSCGDDLRRLPVQSVMFCAIVCFQESRCSGFSFERLALNTYCQLHETYSNPDGSPDTVCYFPGTQTTTTQPPQTTSTARPPFMSPTATSGALAPSTTTSGALPPPVTTMPPATSILNKQKININQKQKCPSNGAAIGIYQDTDYFLICTLAPNLLNFNVGEPEEQCTNPNNQIICMKQCEAGSIIMGYRQAMYTSQGPCSNGFNGNGVTMLDNDDCHTISGLMQLLPDKESTWSQWRVCGGDSVNLYVMTGAEVSLSVQGVWMIDSITCCRVRLA